MIPSLFYGKDGVGGGLFTWKLGICHMQVRAIYIHLCVSAQGACEEKRGR